MMTQDSNSCKEAVYKTLFRTYAKSIFHFIYAKSGHREFAEDIVQEVFLKLWQKCREVPIVKAKSFLFTAASNLFLDSKRREKVVLKFQIQQRGHSFSHHKTPSYLLEEKEFKAHLEHIISLMPEKSRTVFLMSRIESIPYREIAERLSLSQKAVEKRMSIALDYLRTHLDGEMGLRFK